MSTRTDVVVIGGGYAGVMAANRLTRSDGTAVTLITPRPGFVDRIRLHQLVAGTHDAAVDFGRILNRRVRLVVDTVDRIDAAGRTLQLASGGSVRYDHLVYAVGSGSADPTVPGAAEFAFALADLEEARRLRARLGAAPDAAVTVVGAGPTGIEAAAELADTGRSVTLVCGDVLGPSLHPRGRTAVADRLAALGVTVLEGPGATAVEVGRDAVVLEDGRTVPSGVTIWTAGFGVPDLARRSGLTTDAAGRVLTDETLTSVDDDRIVATGDAAAPSGIPYRMSCQAAMQVGPQAAETVLSRIAGRAPAAVRTGFAGQCISLGRRAGVFQFSRRDDRPVRRRLTGAVGARVKEVICRGIVWQLGFEAHRPGLVRWWVSDRSRSARVAAARPVPAVLDPGGGPMIAPADAGDKAVPDAFVTHRDLLFTVAYEMLASAADAEDVLQETWLRWSRVDPAQVENPRAYLVRMITRQALNRLRSVQRRRETYTGSWLPEPLRTTPDVADDVELAERVSMAMMLVLETLPPVERAVFVMREVFDVGYDEIAEVVDRSPVAVRQIAHRAREHVAARRPRRAVPTGEARRVLASFRVAISTGDLPALLEVLSPGVVLIADGGGVKRAALRPIVGAEKVTRFLLGALSRAAEAVRVERAVVNGAEALMVHLDDELDGVLAATVAGGRIDGLYYVRNPEKLSRLHSETPLVLR